MPTTDIDLHNSSVCTDSPTGSDLFPFSEAPTQLIQNTGIERNGGITPLYQQITTFATSATCFAIAKSGDLVQVDSSNNVLFNNSIIGNVGSLAVYTRGIIPQYLDAAWTNNNTIIGLRRKSGSTLTIDEYDHVNATVVNTRDIVFANLGVGSPIINISLIKYNNIAYSDNQEFITLLGDSLNILQESGAAITNIASQTQVANWAWRFNLGATLGASRYIWGRQGYPTAISTTSYWGYGTITSGATLSACQFVTVDVGAASSTSSSNVYFHFPLTYLTQPATYASNAGGMGYAYYSGGTCGIYYQVATGATGATTISVLSYSAGPGYSEATYTQSGTSTIIYNYQAPRPLNSDPSAFAYTVASYTNTLSNSYGKLSGIVAGTSGLVQWRSVMINNIPSFISAAYRRNTTCDDNLGVPLTLLGEVDYSFVPHIVDDNANYSRIIYRNSNGILCFIDIRPTTHTIQSIGDDTFLINCLSPFSVVQVSKKQLLTGPNDYNGRMRISSGAATISTAYLFGALIQGLAVNSYDVGMKTYTNTFIPSPTNSPSAFPVGYNIPSFVDRLPIDFGINTFYGTSQLYNSTYLNFSSTGNQVTLYNQENSLLKYVSDIRVPLAQGYNLGYRSMTTEIETVFLGVGVSGQADMDYDYAAYSVGNSINGVYKLFLLYGQTYIFDGNNIWIVTFNGTLYSRKDYVCPASGLQLIAVSPTEVYFLSSFDNSLYIFNGGRSLTKAKRLNDEDIIINGVYNVRDDTLLLNATSHFLWVRGGQKGNGITTVNSKLPSQTGISLFDTVNGIQIGNTTTKWIYSFYALSGSTTVPLTLQTAFHSLKANETSEIGNWIISVYSADRTMANVQLTCYSFDIDGYHIQPAKTVTINPGDWDALGFFRLRIQPQYRKAIASSLQIYTTSHLVITDISVDYGDEGLARIAAKRSA
jgi:hypothetical protein